MSRRADPWCDWCQFEFGPSGPNWTVKTDYVTGVFCRRECADQWSDEEQTPERVENSPVVTDGGLHE